MTFCFGNNIEQERVAALAKQYEKLVPVFFSI